MTLIDPQLSDQMPDSVVDGSRAANRVVEIKTDTQARDHWRVGRKVGRTVYIGDRLVGLMDTPELAALVVEAVNYLHPAEPQGGSA